MISRFVTLHVACIAFLAGGSAWAEGAMFQGARPLGMGGALRGMATGDAGPLLNPSGMSLIRTYQVEGAYQYAKDLDSHDGRLSAVDSTSSFNLGGALYYGYQRSKTIEGVSRTAHLTGGSLSFPFADKFYIGASAKYLRLSSDTDATKTGFTFDAGLTLRFIPELSVGAVGYNLRKVSANLSPRAFGAGAAVMPIPNLLLAFDTLIQDVEGASAAISYMGGIELSYAASAAFRAGGGKDGLSHNAFVSAGLSGISAEAGSLDLGFRQDVSGTSKNTVFGISARLFVPGM